MNNQGRTGRRSINANSKHAGSPLRWISGLALARHYRLSWLPNDLAAGVALSAVLVPSGMAYAEAAGLPAVNGLYASFAAMLVYAFFGPSRLLVMGPDSALVADPWVELSRAQGDGTVADVPAASDNRTPP